jgi:pimeloyl-ACP methyl ester carboxylesterase
MDRPRLLLVAGVSELEWQIRPQLEEWAEVATFDPPGVGESPGKWSIEAAIERGLQEVDDRGWDEFVLVADGWGPASAMGILQARPDAVRGVAIGHAALTARMTGQRAPLNAAVWDAFSKLVSQGQETFVRFAIPQFTQDGIEEDVAAKIVERAPVEVVEAMMEAVRTADYDLVDVLRPLDLPLLLAKHEGCLVFTDEGYADAVAAFPDARNVSTDKTCSADPAFAGALKQFCAEIY